MLSAVAHLVVCLRILWVAGWGLIPNEVVFF
jgi:hypothetical protein